MKKKTKKFDPAKKIGKGEIIRIASLSGPTQWKSFKQIEDWAEACGHKHFYRKEALYVHVNNKEAQEVEVFKYVIKKKDNDRKTSKRSRLLSST